MPLPGGEGQPRSQPSLVPSATLAVHLPLQVAPVAIREPSVVCSGGLRPRVSAIPHGLAPLAVVVAVVYLLGMLTGGSVVSLFRWAVSDVMRRHEG